MKVKCEFCNGYYEDTDDTCPSCGAPNPNLKRVANDVPRTIDELKEWYQKMNLPPESVTRFFIGKNCSQAKSYGIYQDEVSGKIIVYKNKADGSRAIRYEGFDEVYAVNEIYMKLKETMLEQKEHNAYTSQEDEEAKRRRAQAEMQRIEYMNMENKSFFRRLGWKKVVLFFIILQFALEFLFFAGASCTQCSFINALNNSGNSSFQTNYHYYSIFDDDDDDDDSDSNSSSGWDSSTNSSSDSWDSDWDSGWDSDWDSGWDSDWGSDWDSDW